MKFLSTIFLISMGWLYGTSLPIAAQQTDMLKTIQLSSSTSLIVKRVTEPIASSGGAAPQLPAGVVPLDPSSPLAQRLKETYIVALKTGVSEVDLDHAEFKSTSGAEDSVTPRFAVYDAVLDGSTLHYFFVNKGQILLATAQVDGSGAVSDYHQKPLPEAFARIDTAHFGKDKEGRVTLKVREPGKKTRAFQFDGTGTAVSVPADQSSTTSSQ